MAKVPIVEGLTATRGEEWGMTIEIKHETFEGNKICNSGCVFREDGEGHGRCNLFPDVERVDGWDYMLTPSPHCHPGTYELMQKGENEDRINKAWSAGNDSMKMEFDQRIKALRAENERLRRALQWYRDNGVGCRKIGQAGDPFRAALDRDGGSIARAALEGQV